MDNIQFDEEYRKNFPDSEQGQSTLVRLLLKLGIAKDAKAAGKILIGFSVFMALAGLLLFLSVR